MSSLQKENGAVNIISIGNADPSCMQYALYKVAQSVIRDELINVDVTAWMFPSPIDPI